MISQKSHRVSHARRVHQPCHPPVARSGKVGHLGTLVGLLASLGLAGLAGLPAGAVDPTSPTGTDNTQDRSLTIWAKDSVTVALDPTDPQTSFQPDPKGDALQAAGETHKFKITKITLTGSQTLATVDPSRPATFTAGAVAYVSTDLSTPDNKAVINFSNPVALTDGSGHVKVTAGEVSDDDGATFGPDTTNPLDVFIDTVGTDKTSDGMYIVEEFEGANLKPWAAVIEIPTYTSSQLDTLTTPAPGTINYDIALYAKVKTAITPSFNSYVDILDKPASASGATLVVGRGTGAGADPDTWETIGITKGSTHTFTASFIINGYNRPANTGGVFIGLSDFEMDPNCTITTRREGQNRAPYVVVNSSCVVANKELTTNDNIEFGVLIRNLDDPTLTQYFALYNQAKSAIGQNGSCGGSQLVAPGNVYGFCRIANSSKGGVISQGSYMQFGIPSEAIGPTNPNTGQSSIYEAVALALGATTMTSAVGSPAITNAGDLRTLAGVDISAMNTNHYSSAEEIFGLTSNLQIEITFSQRSRVTGSAFTAGNTSTVNVKPFLYGATNGYATSATVAEDDIFSWEPTVNPPTASDTAAYIGKHFTKRVGQYGYVYTGAVNAIKVDQNGAPLANAKFALIQRAEADPVGNPGVFTNLYASNIGSTGGTSTPAAAGPAFTVSAPTAGTFANVWVVTSDADGKVSFDGVNPDTNSPTGGKYIIAELAQPPGYKDLAHNTIEDESNYGGTTIKAVSLSWADHLTASSKKSDESGYMALTKVINVPILSLPNTGGKGLFWLLAVGLGLLAGSLLIRRHATPGPIV